MYYRIMNNNFSISWMRVDHVLILILDKISVQKDEARRDNKKDRTTLVEGVLVGQMLIDPVVSKQTG